MFRRVFHIRLSIIMVILKRAKFRKVSGGKIIYLPEVHNMDQGLIPNHFDHLCNDNHNVHSERQCHQGYCIPPKCHHGTGAVSGCVEALNEI